jgi:hypothetical protein
MLVNAQPTNRKALAADREHRLSSTRTGPSLDPAVTPSPLTPRTCPSLHQDEERALANDHQRTFASKGGLSHAPAVPRRQNQGQFGSTLASFSWQPRLTFSASVLLAIALLALCGTSGRAMYLGDEVTSDVSAIGRQLVLDAPEPTGQPSSITAGAQVQVYTANPSPPLGGPTGVGSENQWWYFDSNSSYGHIRNSARRDLVLDVRGIVGPVPDGNLVSVLGMPVILYPESKPATLNQLWRWVQVTYDEGIIVSALNPKLVLDVKGNPLPYRASGTKLVVYTVNTPITANQLWFRTPIENIH